MTGSFTVANATTPVVKPTLTLNPLYPNPFIDFVHIESAQNIKQLMCIMKRVYCLIHIRFQVIKLICPYLIWKKAFITFSSRVMMGLLRREES